MSESTGDGLAGRLDALERAASAATRGLPHATLYRYAHGGGRLCLETENGVQRRLIADFYHEEDREYYAVACAPDAIRDLVEIVRAGLRDEHGSFQARADNAEFHLDLLTTEIAALRRALALAALPLETLFATEMTSAWLAPTTKQVIAEAVAAIRAIVGIPAGPEA